MSGGLVAPRAASRAASTPFMPALPGCTLLLSSPVSKNALSPAAWVPAKPSAACTAAASSPIARAAAAAAPNVPLVAVECQKR